MTNSSQPAGIESVATKYFTYIVDSERSIITMDIPDKGTPIELQFIDKATMDVFLVAMQTDYAESINRDPLTFIRMALMCNVMMSGYGEQSEA